MSSSVARHAVFGHPVAHSLSPRIHAAFAQQAGITIDYSAIDVAPEGLADALQAFAAQGGSGANLTLPLKEAAFALCADVSDHARRAGAVNAIVRQGDAWHGHNTDGVGLLRDLRNRQALDLRERRTLLLGAGGAARGVAPSLIDAGIGELFVVNRDGKRADALIDLLGQPSRIHARYYTDLADIGEFDLVINATSAARNGGLPRLPTSLVGRRTACVDLGYGTAAVPFVAWARASNAHDVVDGLGMLVEQAALSFALWHETRPDTDAVYAMLRGEHSAVDDGDD